MINVSKEFLEEMRNRTDFKQFASVKLSNGTVFNIDYSDFTLSNNSIVDGAGESSIPLGVAIEKSIQLEIANDDGKYSDYDFLDAEITLYLQFELSESTESISFGKFTVVTPYTRGSTIIITAVDNMYRTDMPYDTQLAFPNTIGAMLRDSCSATGLLLNSSDFPHNDFTVQEKPTGFTHRQIIGFIAMIAGGNARINRLGSLEILPYNLLKDSNLLDGGDFKTWVHEHTIDGGSFNPWTTGDIVSGGEFSDLKKYHVLFEWMNDPKIDTDDIVITGIQTVYTEEDTEKTLLVGEEGYVLKIENPLIVGKEQEALPYISENLLGSTFRQFEGDHVSYPLAEFMDPVIIVDRNGNIYNSFITDIDFTFLGMTTFKNSAEPALRNGRSYSSAPVEVLRKAKQIVAYEKTEREKAFKMLQETIANSSGMYVTAETQPDGSSIYYAHNKPTLAESDIVWKYTAEAIAVSTDGGKTYPYGFTVTGEMVTRLLYAEGINADYIDTGAITVKDSSGNVIFSVDIDTGSVIISGDFVKIGGKTATQAVSDAITESKDYSDGKLADYANSVIASVENLQAQIDGQIETYYYDYEPTLQNIPASEWTTTEERTKHEGDLFYWKSKGYAYRFFQDGSTWKWQLVQDTDITQAIAAAEKAQDTADNKRRTFVVTPEPPYDIGDLWTQEDGDILTCTVSRSAGSAYVSSDWKKLNNYTDDTVANQALAAAEKATAFSMVLGNEYQGIPTDYEGNYSTFPTVETSVTTYYGHTDVSASCSYSVSKSSGVDGVWNSSTRVYTVAALTTDSGWVDITATYLSTFTVTKRFSIAKIKGGTPGTTGDTGNGIASIKEKYAVSSSNTTAPSTWYDSVQIMTATNKYLWNYEIITYTNGTTVETTKRVIGAYGDTGSDGSNGVDGKGISSIINYYLATPEQTGITTETDGWTTKVQNTTTENKYLWNYEVITYTDSTEFTSAPCIIGTHGETGEQGDPGRSYFIESSVDIVKILADDTTAPSSVTAYAYYRDGEEFEKQEFAGDWGVQLCTRKGEWKDITKYTLAKASITVTIESTIAYGSVSAFRIYLYPVDNDAYIDYVTIPIVKDVFALTHEEVFNLLTNNGTVKGIYQEEDQLYISFTYAKGGTLVLGGTGNEDGVLEVQNSSGEKIGEIDNTGIGFTNTDSSGTVRKVKLMDGGVNFYKDDNRTGTIRRIAWGNDYDNSEGIMFATTSDYLALAKSSGSGWGAGYVLNNGLNPSGYTERNVFFGTTRFTESVSMPGLPQYLDVSLSSVDVTTESASGAYYGNVLDLSEYGLSSNTVLNILIIGWTGAADAFNVYYQGGYIRVMSGKSMTISSLKLRIVYI